MSDPNLTAVSVVAEQYAKAYLSGDRTTQKNIVVQCTQYTAFQMAYFCQEVVSHIPTVQQASMCLTVLTNRLQEALEAKPLPESQPAADPLAQLDKWNRKYYSFVLRADGNYQPGDGPHITLTAGGRKVSVGEYELVTDEDKWPGIGEVVAEALRRWHADPAPKNFLVYVTHPTAPVYDTCASVHFERGIVGWQVWHGDTKLVRITAMSEAAALEVVRWMFPSEPSSLFAYEVDAEWKH